MSSLKSRSLAFSCLQAIALALSIASVDVCQGADQTTGPSQAVVLRLKSQGLPVPLAIPGDSLKRQVTSVELRGELTGDGKGQGFITLDESTLKFNEYGDAAMVKPKAAEPSKVSFTLRENSDSQERRKLYEIAFADESFINRFLLVISVDGHGPHRLLVRRGDAPARLPEIDFDPARRRPLGLSDFALDYRLEMHGAPELKPSIPAGPFPAKFSVSTLCRTPKGFRQISVRGSLAEEVYLDIDPNHLMFNHFGDVVGSTLIGHFPPKTRLVPLDVVDPLMKERRLFEVEPMPGERTSRYFVVLGKTEDGPHRLLIREGETLQHVLPLNLSARRQHLAMQARLETVPAVEQLAVAELRKSLGYQFSCTIESNSIVGLSVLGADKLEDIDSALKQLKSLRRLECHNAELGPRGLPSLTTLTRLEQLHFTNCQIDDRGLASLKDLNQLRSLMFYVCRGITDNGLAHFAGLKSLKHLRLYREDTLRKSDEKVELITDAGLAHLQGLGELEYLNLMGQRITDAGLVKLKGLANLKDLNLSGAGISDAGLRELQGLSKLSHLHLYGTRVTAEGKAELKAKLPKIDLGF